MALQASVDAVKSKDKERNSLNWQFKTAIGVALITSFTSIFLQYIDNKPNQTEKMFVQIVEKLNNLESTRPPVKKQ